MKENIEQNKAINLIKGPCVILAGAGTGKTYTIRQKIKHLVENNYYKPKEILCLTFSNEATNNLRNKISEDINELSNDLTIKTFHSFCYEIIKENTDFFKIKEDIQIISPDDFKVFLHKYFNIDAYYSNRYVNTIQNCKDFGITIEQIKQYIQEKILQKLIDVENIAKLEEVYKNKQKRLSTLYLELNNADKDYKKDLKQEKKEIKEFIENYQKYIKFNKFIETWEKYEEFKKEKGYLDYGDLNKFVLEYFKEMGSEKYVDSYKYVFIDEFQDTNKLQFELIKHIAKHKNITVVGDLNQSIYGFRGSYKESFEEFNKFFNVLEEDICKLDISYRSTNKILNTSYDLIKNNFENIEDCVKIQSSEEKEGKQVKCISFNNQYEEARFITDDILEKKENISLDKLCVLVRTHKQAEVIKQAFELKKIPYVYAGKKNLLDKPEIQTVVSYLSILSNLIERKAIGDISWWNLFHYSNLLSAKDSYKIGKFLKNNKSKQITINDILLEINKEDLGLSLEGKKIIERILQRFEKILKISNKKIPEIVLEIYDICGINRKFTYTRNLENTEHLYNLKKFYEISENFYKMHSKIIVDFVEYLEIINKLNITVESERINNKNAVRIMTIHASKGLEFNTVYITNLAKDRFPVTRTENDPLIPKELLEDRRLKIEQIKKDNLSLDESKLEKLIEKEIKNYEKEIFLYEERRLFYVAITRAEENLFFTYAKSYNDSDKEYTKSVFLEEINIDSNENVFNLGQDDQNLSTIITPDTKCEKYKQDIKNNILELLDSGDIDEILEKTTKYLSLREESNCDNYLNKNKENNNLSIVDNLQKNIANFKINKENIDECLQKYIDNKNNAVFNKDEFTFSASGINTYLECPKKFELQHIYQMPQVGSLDEIDLDDDISSGKAVDKGSFLHKLLEIFVNENKKTIDEGKEICESLLKEEFKDKVTKKDLEEILLLLEVFIKRHKDKLENDLEKCETEKKIFLDIEGYKFKGYIDRVDYLSEPNKKGFVDIIDYKTNKKQITPHMKRKVQLGIYALSLKDRGYKLNKLVLDMLKLDTPFEMIVDPINQDDVSAFLGTNRSSNFKLSEIREEILQVCKKIEHDYKTEFKPNTNKDQCLFCGYKFYCPLWRDE